MQNVILSTDSCCDIYKKELKEKNVNYISLKYIHNGTEYADEFTQDSDYSNFYNFLRSGNLPTTTQLNTFETAEYFEKLLNTNNGELVHITLSSGLSGTFNNAVAAAREVEQKLPGRKIYVIDSRGATLGQMLLVDRAIKMRLEGKTAKEIFDDIQSVAPRVHHLIMANDLFHLKRGGRVSAVSAIVGTILQIKPIIVMTSEGKLLPVEKMKGITKAFHHMVKNCKKDAEDVMNQTLYIAHADCPELAADLKAMVQEEIPVPVKIGYIGPIIGTHTGPGTVGLVFIGCKKPK